MLGQSFISTELPQWRRYTLKIAISATAPGLDAEVDPRFGRCQYFVLIDLDNMEFEAIENANLMASGGAGIASAQTVASKGVQIVLTGDCGPNAYRTLEAAGIQVVTGVSGNIRKAIERYKSGEFKTTSKPSVCSHSGMGRVMSKGVGAARESATTNVEQELGQLKSQSQMLRHQLNEVMFRLNQLEKRATP
jgi:predicted Fe-Mo cluster-binding NifX family protein